MTQALLPRFTTSITISRPQILLQNATRLPLPMQSLQLSRRLSNFTIHLKNRDNELSKKYENNDNCYGNGDSHNGNSDKHDSNSDKHDSNSDKHDGNKEDSYDEDYYYKLIDKKAEEALKKAEDKLRKQKKIKDGLSDKEKTPLVLLCSQCEGYIIRTKRERADKFPIKLRDRCEICDEKTIFIEM